MKLQVIMSCMYEQDLSIVQRSNVQTDIVVVNQCDINSVENHTYFNKKGKECKILFINSTERGLSRSRNMCIAHSTANVLVVCDDDEVFEDNYEESILNTYALHQDVSFIVFNIKRANGDIHTSGKGSLSLKKIINASSVQMTFKKDDIVDKKIIFDEKMGSGTENGGAEETKFMMDIRRAGLKMCSEPQLIASLLHGEGKWQNTTTQRFFENLGWTSRRWGKLFIGYAFIWYNFITHRKEYRKQCTLLFAFRYLHKGFFEDR